MLAAACLPPLLAAVAAALVAVLVAVPVTAVAAAVQDVPATWDVAPAALLGWTAAIVLVVATGLALGMLFRHAPTAIVICLSTPVLWSAVAGLGPTGAALAAWLDLNTTSGPLAAGAMTGGEVLRLTVSAVVWIVLPMTAGAVRTVRADVA